MVAAPEFLLEKTSWQLSGWKLLRGVVLTDLFITRLHIYLRRPIVLGGWEDGPLNPPYGRGKKLSETTAVKLV